MVWFAVWSSIAFEPRCLAFIRFARCSDPPLDFIRHSQVIREYENMLVSYTTDLSNNPASWWPRRRRKPSGYDKSTVRYYMASKHFMLAEMHFEKLNQLLIVDGAIQHHYVAGITDSLEFWLSVFYPTRSYEVVPNYKMHSCVHTIHYVTNYDIRYIRDKLARLADKNRPVSYMELCQIVQFALCYPIRYIKAIIKCFDVIPTAIPIDHLESRSPIFKIMLQRERCTS